MADLLVIVPTRGRPDNLRRVIEAWRATGAFADAALLAVIDADDPQREAYERIEWDAKLADPELIQVGGGLILATEPEWLPMVHKLNRWAATAASSPWQPFALAFAGDDHLPRTHGWARRYLDELHDLGTGIVYGDDLLQGANLPTQWAMTSDIVRTLGRMVPADVQHLYCDNAIAVLGQAAGCLRYLPDVVVEHVHPLAGKAEMDDGYRRVNSSQRYRDDRAAFLRWVAEGFDADTARIKALREVAVHG